MRHDLPMYIGTTVCTYTWAEQAVADYTSTASAEGPDMTFTNTHAPETTSVSVKKIWDDKNDVAGKRPANLIVTLSNGTEVTLNESNNWTATVNDLPKYANGTEITYTWTEKNVPTGYAVTSNTQDANDPSLTNITNYYDLNQETTSLSITKDWDDFNNAAGKRPDSLTVELYADGVLSTTVTLKATENWTATVSGLPIYDPTTGAKITYDWSEGTMPAGYSLKSVATGTTSTTITNTYDLSRELIKVTVHKDWDDENNLAGKRPANLTVNLSNGDQVVLNDANGWTASVNDLPKFDALGNEISYTWTEDTLDAGYSISAYTDDPSDPANLVTTIVNTFDLTQEKTSASVEKIWDDNNNQDGKRPTELVVTLLQDGQSYRSVTLNESNNWKASFDDLPKFNGTSLYDYTWEEPIVADYTSSSSTTGADMKFTNTHAPELISLSVKKVWEDFDNVAGKRPDSLTVTLSNGTEVTLNEANNWTATVDNLPKYADNDYRVTITANGGNGQILVQNLPMGTYMVTEDEDAAKITGMHLGISYENQTVTLSENNRQKDTIIRNNYTDYSLKVKKVVTGTPPYNNNTYEYAIKCGDQYVQANGQLGSNIHYFTIAAGEEQEVVLFQTGDYSVVERFANWAMEGTEKAKDYNIHYSMQTTYSSDSVTVNGQNETGEITITNHYTHNVEKGSLTVSKTEAGDIPATGKPSSYTFYVKCGTQYVQDDSTGALGTDPVAFTVSTTGDKVIDGLDLNKTYIVEEIAVTGLPEGYTCAATYSESSVTLNSTDKDGSIAITNTYTYTAPETVEATVKKVWDDNDNQDGIRPVSLTVDLLKNGTKIDEVTLNAGNNWSATKSGLKKYDNGVLNVYTWSEPTITGYTSATMTQDTVTTFTNTHAPEEISVSVKKNWSST